MRTGVIAQKVGMTRVFAEDGGHVPVTVLQLDNCQVVAVRTQEKDGYVAVQLGVPVVPVSLVGSFRHHRTGHWMLWPGTITVHVHDTIETATLSREEISRLRDRVREAFDALLRAAPPEITEDRRRVRRPPRRNRRGLRSGAECRLRITEC